MGIKTKASGMLNKLSIAELHLSSWLLNFKDFKGRKCRQTEDHRISKDDSFCPRQKGALGVTGRKLPLKARVPRLEKKKKEPRNHIRNSQIPSIVSFLPD